MPETKTLFVEKPKNARRFAISDIHGCSKTFKALLEQIHLKKDDQLFLLGDFVNRGPDSAGVIDEVLKLKKDGFQVYCLRGNHDQMILDAAEKSGEKLKKILEDNNSLSLLKGDKIRKKYKQFLEDTFYYLEVDEYFMVHAGFDFHADEPFENYNAMMNIPKFKAKKKWLNGKKVIHGHNPKVLSKIMQKIKKGKKRIHIDNGCANAKTKGQGNLLCFNLDSKAISVQQNIEDYG